MLGCYVIKEKQRLDDRYRGAILCNLINKFNLMVYQVNLLLRIHRWCGTIFSNK